MKVLTSILLIFVAISMAAQEGLYAPSLPEDAALVRVVNATGHKLSLDIGPLRFGDVTPGAATAYRPLHGDVFVIAHNGVRAVLTPEPRTFLTVVLEQDDVRIVTDERHADPARAQLVIYNLTSVPVAFKAVVPAAVLVEAVDPGHSASRAVNAVSVTIGAFVDDEPLYVTAVDLERGESYTLVVLEEGEPPGFLVQASVSTE